jgi:hypothetical protein
MRRSSSTLLSLPKLSALILSILVFSTLSFAAAPDRITGTVVSHQLIKFSAGVPMKAQPQYDQGRVDPSFKLSYMTLLTVPSASQQKAINRLLAQQQDRRSPLYHKWLTPEQYADRFGLSPNDVKKITTWLQSQGFSILEVARARNFVVFSGTAAQAESAFQTQIHNFDVDGEKHFANTTPPSIPAALSAVVSGIRGLSNFRPKSHALHSKPNYTLPVTGGNVFFLAPGDIATIYDIDPLYTAGIDGTGQTLAVIGQTDVYLADLNDFRAGFGITQISGCTTNASNVITACNAANFKYVPVGTDPGVPNSQGSDDLFEADIDLEWSAAVAHNAQIIYVNAPETAQGVWDAWYAAVNQNLSPVITMSYGLCELFEAENGAVSSDEAELQFANLAGITFLNSSGDSGAAECDFQTFSPTGGYAVGYPASSPSVTGVGGTLIPYPNYTTTGTNPYWSTTNGTDGASALRYIPEEAWNDEQEAGEFCSVNPSSHFCAFFGIVSPFWQTAQSSIGVLAGGGGKSNCKLETGGVCSVNGGFAQPTWQQGLALPPGTPFTPRFSPDVSLLASVYWPGFIICTPVDEIQHNGNTASICASGIASSLNTYGVSVGGTSISSPIFAGIVTLLNQYLGTSSLGLGNINPTLYSLAAAPANGAFHPVEVGSIGAFCPPGTPIGQLPALQCPPAVPPATDGFLGFDASNFDPTTGYNLATGLGSVDANNLAIAWAASLLSATTTTVTTSQSPANWGVAVTFTATVATAGANPPTGTVTFNDGTTALGTGTLSTVSGSQVATFTTSTLAPGSHSITAVYGGDANNAPSTSAILTQIIVAPTFSLSTPTAPGTVLSGQSTTSTFTVTPTGGPTTFTDDVTFACNGLLDATVRCSFNTGQADPTKIAAGSGATPVIVTIATTGPNQNTADSRRRRADNRSPWLPLALPLAGIVMVGFAGRKISKYSAIAGLCVSLVFLGLLVACGGSNPPVAVSVSPAGATVFASNTADSWPPQTATFTATVTNNSNTAVTWAVTTTNGGSITSAGVYTAPTIAVGLPGSATITATSQADSTKSAAATVTITPTTVPTSIVGAPYSLTVTATEGPTQHTTSAIALTVN